MNITTPTIEQDIAAVREALSMGDIMPWETEADRPQVERWAREALTKVVTPELLTRLCDAIEREQRRAIEFGDILAQYIIAMQAAVIDDELRGAPAGIRWIANTLFGPGHYPDISVAREMGDAQAWFDAKMAEHEAFRAAHPAPPRRGDNGAANQRSFA